MADYHAGEEQDLHFDEGDTIGVTSKEDDAWWKGFVYARKNGDPPDPHVAEFPANYVKPMPNFYLNS